MHGLYRNAEEAVKAAQRLTWPQQLVQRRAEANATAAALIVHDLSTGRIEVVGGFPAEQTRSFTNVPRGYQCTVAGLLLQERLRLRSGWATVSEYQNRRTLSDRKIERFIAKGRRRSGVRCARSADGANCHRGGVKRQGAGSQGPAPFLSGSTPMPSAVFAKKTSNGRRLASKNAGATALPQGVRTAASQCTQSGLVAGKSSVPIAAVTKRVGRVISRFPR